MSQWTNVLQWIIGYIAYHQSYKTIQCDNLRNHAILDILTNRSILWKERLKSNVNNSININKTNNHLSLQTIVHKYTLTYGVRNPGLTLEKSQTYGEWCHKMLTASYILTENFGFKTDMIYFIWNKRLCFGLILSGGL